MHLLLTVLYHSPDLTKILQHYLKLNKSIHIRNSVNYKLFHSFQNIYMEMREILWAGHVCCDDVGGVPLTRHLSLHFSWRASFSAWLVL